MLEPREISEASRELMDVQAGGMRLRDMVPQDQHWVLDGLLSMARSHQQLLTILLEDRR